MKFLVVILLVVLISSCEKNDNISKYSPPSDHTISKHGALHKSGLDKPETNCISCHGSDLKGGTSGVSCFECHNKEW